MMRACTGAPALLVAAAAWLVMEMLSARTGAPDILPAAGTLLVAPQEWGLPGWLSTAAAALLTAGCAIALWVLNKRYCILPGPGAIYSAILFIGCGAYTCTGAGLRSGIIVAATVIACIFILFSLYGRRNATQGCMLLFSLLSWGSMAQSACLMLMPVFLLGTMIIGVCRGRELLASLLGIVAPYWIVIGTGIATPGQLQLSMPEYITSISCEATELIWIFTTCALTGLLLLMLMLYNALHMHSSGVMMRSFHSFINMLGCACICLMLVDSGRLMAYIPTTLICLGLTATHSFELSRSPRAWILPLSIAIMYIILYMCHD